MRQKKFLAQFPHALSWLLGGISLLATQVMGAAIIENVMITDVPDYGWYAGCFSTAAGNLMGYWDRHGLDDFYTGPTGGGVAPLHNFGANLGIRSMWGSKAGLDGRPANKPGHIDDYWIFYNDDLSFSYESAAPDPYVTAGRQEHEPDCIADFIGASQNKWTNLNGESDGNIDAYAVTYWDLRGAKRVNYVPPPQNGAPVLDIPSGLKAWTKYRGYDCDVFSQLVDFNSNVTAGQGFTFEDLKAEIDAGYPVMLFLQQYNQPSRPVPGMENANPDVHGMLAFGYLVTNDGAKYVRYKTSWSGSGDNTVSLWSSLAWQIQLPLRGVIGYHPLPRIQSVSRNGKSLTIKWHGPNSFVNDLNARTITEVHRYVIEKADSIQSGKFVPISEPKAATEATVSVPSNETVFFRVRLEPRAKP
jgi:hypothetical protein